MHRQETREKISKSLKRVYKNNLELKAKLSQAHKGKPRPASVKVKISATLLGHSVSVKTRGKIGRANKGYCPTLETRKKISINTRIGQQRSGAIAKIQTSSLAHWQDPDYARKVLTFRRPNKAESALIDIIERNNLPFKYVGDGQFILGGKCPDFLNVNGKKQLIEFFGAHWHPIFDVARRKEHFGQYGFQTLILWEDEVKTLVEHDVVK